MQCPTCGSGDVQSIRRKKSWLERRGDEDRVYIKSQDSIYCDTCGSEVPVEYHCRDCGCHWCGTCVRGYGRTTIS